MDLGLNNKVAIVTGASRGLGKSISEALAREGCRLIICARGEEGIREVEDELRSADAEVRAVTQDITDPDAGERLCALAVGEFGRVDVLVGSAGGNRRGPFAETSDADWRDIVDLNLLSHLRCARAVIPEMRRVGGGSIVFLASIFGREAGGRGLSIYNSTKSALISAAKIMAIELASEDIRVNTVAPGSIRFPGGSWDRRVQENPDAMAEFVRQNIPMGRFGRAEEIADVVAFLASERASLVTGACLNADGGQSRALI